MRKIILILFLFYPALSFGQTTSETKDDFLPFDNSLLNNNKSETPIPFQFRTPALFNDAGNDSLIFMNPFPNNLTIKLPNFSDIKFSSTFNPDGNLYNQYYINARNWVNTSRIQSNFIGLGGMTMFGANYNWRIGEFVIITGGIYASKYNIYNNFRNDTGVNGNIKFILSDRISMNLFGQYSVNGINNAVIPLMSPLYPQSFYGGSFEFKVNDKWGFLVGAEREFDVMARKWITKPFIMPLFYRK